MPTFSVIIPNYNHARYLPEQLDAILSQSLQPSTLLVVDDASTDHSCEIVQSYQKQHPHISLIQLEKNSGGPIIPVRVGLQTVDTDYVSLCASDDIIQPGFFEESMQFVARHPEVALCFGRSVVFEDRKPYEFRELFKTSEHPQKIFHPDEWIKVLRYDHLEIPSQATLYKRSCLLEVGSYDERLKGYSDYYVNYQLAFKYPIAFVPGIWGGNRIVKTSYGRDLHPKERAKLCAEIMKKLDEEPKHIQKRWKNSGILCRAGKQMLLHLLGRVKYWPYIPALLMKYSSYRIKKLLSGST